MPIRAVFDTNVIVSGALFGGVPRELLEAAINHCLSLFISDEIIEELIEVLRRPKFKLKAPLHPVLVAQVLELATKVAPVRNKTIRLNDQDDRIIVDCAIAAKAEYIVTGDTEFLSYGKISQVAIISPRDMLRLLHP